MANLQGEETLQSLQPAKMKLGISPPLQSQQTGQPALYLAPQKGVTSTPFSPSGASSLADLSGGNYTDAFNPAGGGGAGAAPAQPKSVLDSLPQDLADSYKQTLQSMMSGKSYQANMSINNEGFVRAANALRARGATTAVGAAGQGAAIANQNAAENTILGMASQNDLSNQIATEQTKQAGLGAANSLVGLEEQSRQFGVNAGQEQQKINLATLQNSQSQAWSAFDRAVASGSFDAAATEFEKVTGKPLDTTQLKTAQDYMNAKQGIDIAQGNLNLDQMKQSLGNDKYNAIQNMVNTGATVDQINAQYGAGTLTQDQYNSMATIYNSSIDAMKNKLGADKYNAIQNMVNTGATADQINAQYGAGTVTADQYNSMKAASDTTFRLTQLMQSSDLAKLGIASSEKIAGMQISNNKAIAQMQIDSAEKLAKDETYLKQQGVDLNKAAVEGYTDSKGNHVPGSAEIAAKELGLKATTVADAHGQLWGGVDASGVFRPGTLANMDSETRLKSEELFGSIDALGNFIPGTLTLQASKLKIEKQGMDLQTAALKGFIDNDGNFIKGSMQIEAEKAGATIDTLKGYIASDGTKVPGSLELAAKQFGLQSDTLAMQKDEIQQKYALLSAEDRRAAEAMYGRDVLVNLPNGKATSVHYAGTMELQAQEMAIKKQGLTLEEAQIKGYNTTDDNGNPIHIAGNLENAATQLGLAGKTYQDQHDELFGYYDNTKKAYVPGKIDSMNQADKNAAYALYGDPDNPAIKGSLALENSKVMGDLANQRREISNTYQIQNRQVEIQEQSADSASYWDTAKKLATYATTHLDADPTKDAGAKAVMADWWKTQTGTDPSSNPAGFQAFAKTEWKAATDNRLTNPIDQSIYTINSSKELDQGTKDKMIAMLKDTGANISFTQDKDGKIVIQHIDEKGNVINGGFVPDITFDPNSSNAASSFTKAGFMWKGTEGTTQTTAPLSEGQKITLVNNATVQYSNTVIPKGNYTVIKQEGIMYLRDVDSGKLYKYSSNYSSI